MSNVHLTAVMTAALAACTLVPGSTIQTSTPGPRSSGPRAAPTTATAQPMAPAAQPMAPAATALDGWHRYNEDRAVNDNTDSGGNTALPNKQQHAEIVRGCGHDVAIRFDWDSFDMAEWKAFFKGSQNPDAGPADYCLASPLDTIRDACTTEGGLKRYKPAAAAVKTITCHSKRCDQLKTPQHYADITPTNGGANLDVWVCPGQMAYMNGPQWDKMFPR